MLKFAVPDKPIQLVDKRERSADAKEGGTQSKPKEARRKLFRGIIRMCGDVVASRLHTFPISA